MDAGVGSDAPSLESAAALVRANADFWTLPRASPLVRVWLFPDGDSAAPSPPPLQNRPAAPANEGGGGAHTSHGLSSVGGMDPQMSTHVAGTSANTHANTFDTGNANVSAGQLRFFPNSAGLAFLHVCSAPSCAAGPGTRTTVLKRTAGVPLAVSCHPGGLTLGYIIEEVWAADQAPNVQCIARFAHNFATRELLKVTIVQNGSLIHVDRFVGLSQGCFMHDHVVARPAGPKQGRNNFIPGFLPEPLLIDSRTTALLRRRETAAPAGAVPVEATHRDFGRDALGCYDFYLVTPCGGYLNSVPQPAPPMASDARAAPAHLACCRMPSVFITELVPNERDMLRERLITILTQDTAVLFNPFGAAPVSRSIAAPYLNIVEPTSDCLQVLDPSPSLTLSSPVTWISASSTPVHVPTGRPSSNICTPVSAMRSMSPIAHSPTHDSPSTRRALARVSAMRPTTLAGSGSGGADSAVCDTRQLDSTSQRNMAITPNSDAMQSSTIYIDNLVPLGGQDAIRHVDPALAQHVPQQGPPRPLHSQQQLHVSPPLDLRSSELQQSFSRSMQHSIQRQPQSIPSDQIAHQLLAQLPLSQQPFAQQVSQQMTHPMSQTLAHPELHMKLQSQAAPHLKSLADPHLVAVHETPATGASSTYSSAVDNLRREGMQHHGETDIVFDDFGGPVDDRKLAHGVEVYDILAQHPSAKEGLTGRPGEGECEERLDCVEPQGELGGTGAALVSSTAMSWLGVGSGAALNYHTPALEIHSGISGPDVSDLFGSLPLAASQSQVMPVVGAQNSTVVPLIGGAHVSGTDAAMAAAVAAAVVAAHPPGTARSSTAPVLLPLEQKPTLADDGGNMNVEGRVSQLDAETVARLTQEMGCRTRGRGGRGSLAATPSDIVMRNRISAQKSNEKRRRRILASRSELATLKSVTLPRLQMAQLVLRAENERVRQALASKYGRHWVTVESFF
jgi:hypothetical protein